jgi:chromosome segregation ATPase
LQTADASADKARIAELEDQMRRMHDHCDALENELTSLEQQYVELQKQSGGKPGAPADEAEVAAAKAATEKEVRQLQEQIIGLSLARAEAEEAKETAQQQMRELRRELTRVSEVRLLVCETIRCVVWF